MRLSPLVLALSIAAMPATLQAAPKSKAARKAVTVPGTHKVRKGETAARIARQYRLEMAELETLNPELELDRLKVGSVVRVAGRPSAPRLVPSQARNLEPVIPVPTTPNLRPGSLVHLERVLPAVSLAPVPDGKSLSGLAPAGDPKAMVAQMVPVVPRTEIPPTPSFDPADPSRLDLLWPVATRTVSSGWGPRMRTRTVRVVRASKPKKIRQRYQGAHRGVDLTAPVGTDIYAAMDGTVIEATRHKQYGNYVVVDHGNGVTTLYAHSKVNFVRVGELVRRGQKIAEVGMTGRTTGPHLHFEVRFDGVHQNPFPFLNEAEEIPTELVALNEAAVPPARSRR